MKVNVKWFLTGKITTLDEPDSILSSDSTIAEVKGLIQIRFGFNVREIVIIKEHLLENNVSLKSIGIVGQPTDPVLVAHVIRESELEGSNLDVDDATNDDELQEFSHADFIMAMKMLGKDVPVADERIVAMRLNAPRQRPAFLNATPTPAPSSASAAPVVPPSGIPGVRAGSVQTYDPRNTEVYKIFANVQYGLRREGVESEFAIEYPGVESFEFWDMRTPDALAGIDYRCSPGEVCLELFYFGEFSAIKDQEKFLALVRQSLESKAGVRLSTPHPLREAGCMYPLVACPIILHEMDAFELGDRFFEEFGKKREGAQPSRTAGDRAVAGGGGCAPQ